MDWGLTRREHTTRLALSHRPGGTMRTRFRTIGTILLVLLGTAVLFFAVPHCGIPDPDRPWTSLP